MAKFGTFKFTGESGKVYEFTAYSRDTDFKALGAVYGMTKRTVANGSASHKRLYVGQTGNLSDRPLNHHKTDCFDRHGANCVCVYLESNEKKRLAIETDICRNYDLPCNG